MKILKIKVALCCLAMLAGCQQAEEIENLKEELPMSVEASIKNTIVSRYISSSGTHIGLSFAKGDQIGVFVDDRSAVKWEMGESGWTSASPVYWPDKAGSHQFYAFYPFVEGSYTKSSVPMPSLAGQKGLLADLDNFDFLVAEKSQSYSDGNGVVSFTGEYSFTHASSLITIQISASGDLNGATVNSISFEADDVTTQTTYSFGATSSVIMSTVNTSNVLEASEMDCVIDADKTLYFILNAGVQLQNMQFTIKYTSGGKQYAATKTGLGSATLEGGQQYNFKLNITDGILNITGGDIADWGNGGEMDDIIINGVEESNTNS